jgi:hypothetical protein
MSDRLNERDHTCAVRRLIASWWATGSPWVADGPNDNPICFFCSARRGDAHEPDCLYYQLFLVLGKPMLP